jgi:RNA polymerase sigma-70 factor (ECF subfamily)
MTTIEFSKVVTNERSALRNYAYQLTRDLNDTHDLVQETMLKAFSNKEKFQDGTNIKGWLYTIMKNSFINNYRKLMKRAAMLSASENAYLLDSFSPATLNTGEDRFMMKDLKTAVDSLPEDLRKTFLLNFKGFKYHEIAEILIIPIGTVKTRIFMARKILRSQLKAYGEAYGLREN